MDVAYNLAAGVLVIIAAAMAYQNKRMSAFVMLVAALLAATFGHLDRIADVKAALGSLEITMREARNDIEQMKQMAILLSQSIYDSDRFTGSIGGMSSRIKDSHRASVLAILAATNVDQNTIDQIKQRYYEEDLEDYAWGIKSTVDRNWSKKSEPTSVAFDEAFLAHGRVIPTPDEIELLMKRFSVDDPTAGELLGDYREFIRTRQHRRPEIWANRDTWFDRQ